MIEQKQQKQKNRKLSFVNEEQSVISKSTKRYLLWTKLQKTNILLLE